ncbi:uncharacterized protein MONBRDRAFT_33988 [Monosiga brevicollis MX1]|uniref:Uncharacterized protein n=1 Tax=Monosiga brevicollis TaxID=81824 RepID=A9V8Y5_MONBE|nr:uncharacterized protein MONBRDRAFT_33988 [Monosiga brevicollis MX1]EDQ86039.1 predicted protein [Monosiga brevicollis MX1]|eukprot:XP_001749233.1 hypothetical protein [Monosiga brevicollis MX1]
MAERGGGGGRAKGKGSSRRDPKQAFKERASARRAEQEMRGAQVHEPQHSIDALLSQAESLQSTNPDVALQFVTRALAQDPLNTEALEFRAVINLSLDHAAEAYADLRKCVEIEPHNGWSKYMYLGQLSSGQEAADMLSAGIQLMAEYEANVASKPGADPEEIKGLHEDISAAFCSLAEVYLTDLCEEDEAQDTCLALMDKALAYDPTNIEALQTLSSIHMSMSQPDQAWELLNRSLAVWWYPLNGDADQQGAGEAMDVDDDAAAPAAIPPYELRINTCKLLIEMEQYQLAVEVAAHLLEEDEQIMQVWYLFGWALYLQKDPEALKTLQHAEQVYLAQECERPDVLEHIHELLRELQSNSAE